MTDADVEQTAARHASSRPTPIDRVAAEQPTSSEPAQSEEDDADPAKVLCAALERAPVEGVSVPDLVAATGRSRRWVYYRLRTLAVEGRAEQTERGGWRATPPNETHAS